MCVRTNSLKLSTARSSHLCHVFEFLNSLLFCLFFVLGNLKGILAYMHSRLSETAVFCEKEPLTHKIEENGLELFFRA